MGPTPTRMRLSCNFVNVCTIAYRVQYTFTCVHAHIPNGHPRDDPRAEVGEDVRVGVGVGGVRVGPVEFKLNGRAFAGDPKGRGFESWPVRIQVTALGKLLTRMCLCYQAV